jgi:hypothetical protein
LVSNIGKGVVNLDAFIPESHSKIGLEANVVSLATKGFKVLKITNTTS